MSITKLEINNGTMHKKAEISFKKGRIASIVGLNGHGKTQILNSLSPQSTNNFKTSEPTWLSPSFVVSDEDRDALKNLPIYDALGIDFDSLFVKDNYHRSASNMDREIIAKIKAKFKMMIEADGTEAAKRDYDAFIAEVQAQEETWANSFLPSLLAHHPLMSNYRTIDLTNGLNAIASWDVKMKQIIKYKTIDTNKAPADFRFNMKNEGGPELASFNINTYWFIRLLYLTGTFNDFKKIMPTMADSDPVILDFQNKLSTNFSKILNQKNLKVKFNLTKYSGVTYTMNITYMEGETPLRYDALSTGTKKYINIVAQLGSTNENTVLLIDEPDTGLHPGLQIDLREKIKEVTNATKCVVVLTTHSVYMLNHLNNRVNTYVSHKVGDSQAELHSITNFHRLQGSHQNAQIWDMLGYGTQEKNDKLTSDSKVLLVEGESDVIFVKAFLKMNSISLGEWKIIPAYGDGRVPYELKYMKEVLGIPYENIKCLLDGDTSDKDSIQSKIDELGVNKKLISFQTIEDIFVGNDKGRYTKTNADGKYVNKLDRSIKFSYSLDVSDATKTNIDSITNDVVELLELNN